MADLQDDMIERLQTLVLVPGAKVAVTKTKRTITIEYETVYSLNFRFKWRGNHYVGYPVDAEGDRANAVVSLWSASEAAHFVMAYTLLAELRADRRT